MQAFQNQVMESKGWDAEDVVVVPEFLLDVQYSFPAGTSISKDEAEQAIAAANNVVVANVNCTIVGGNVGGDDDVASSANTTTTTTATTTATTTVAAPSRRLTEVRVDAEISFGADSAAAAEAASTSIDATALETFGKFRSSG